MKIAVVGSRDYPHLDDVRALISLIAREHPEATIVSGGAEGVDTTAEQEGARCALKVISFRVRQLNGPLQEDEFGIEEWGFGAQRSYVRLMREEPTWGTYDSALQYRNGLIAERADRMVAFKGLTWRGTGVAMDWAQGKKMKLKVYGVDADRFQVSA